MRIPLTRYGVREICLGLAACGAAAALLALCCPWAAAVPALLGLWVLYFFRDPTRRPPDDPRAVVAPADGKITEIGECEEPEFIQGPALKISIFLSVFNVHLNRAPYRGRVAYLKYQKGAFVNAMNPESGHRNEHNCIGIETSDDAPVKLLVKQIAGLIARRIVCDCTVGDEVDTGQIIGMIKFGSRTDLFIPKEAAFELTAQVGQTVAAGETILGRFS